MTVCARTANARTRWRWHPFRSSWEQRVSWNDRVRMKPHAHLRAGSSEPDLALCKMMLNVEPKSHERRCLTRVGVPLGQVAALTPNEKPGPSSSGCAPALRHPRACEIWRSSDVSYWRNRDQKSARADVSNSRINPIVRVR